jgi:peptide/nickel transport system substrate-binding protein
VFRRARRSILTVSVVFAMLAAALGGSAAASPQRSATSSSAPQHGGDVTEAVGSSFSGWIPDDAVLADDVNILPAVYGNLVFISNDGKGIVPMLAKSLDFDAAAKTLTVHLQPNAKFSNGQPVTSTDVAFSVNQWKAGPNYGALVSSIQSVDTPDPQTAVFHLSIADTYLSTALAMSNFEIMPNNFDGMTQAQFFAKPIGAGPFMIQSQTPNQQLVLVPNPHYFDPTLPYVKKLTLNFIQDPNQRSLQFKSNAADFIEPPVPYNEAQQLSGVDYVTNANLSQDLVANWTTAPGSSKDFRRAISLALNRAQLAQGVFGGKAVPSKTALPPNVPNQVPPSGNRNWATYDPSQAKKLLAASGYKGKTLDFIVPSTQADTTLLAQAIQAELQKVGIKSHLEQLDEQTWYTRWSGGQYDLTMTFNTSAFPSAGLYMSTIATPFGWLLSGAPNNFAVAQFANFRVATTNAQRDAAVQQVENWAYDNVAYIPVVDQDMAYAVHTDTHIPINGIAMYPFWEIWRQK